MYWFWKAKNLLVGNRSISGSIERSWLHHLEFDLSRLKIMDGQQLSYENCRLYYQNTV